MTASVVEDETALVRSIVGLGAVDDVLFEDEGWDSRVYLVNHGEIVFKFPRTAAARAAYANEIAIMRLLDGGDDAVRVPIVEWVGPDREYFGYRGIVGTQLGRGLDAVSPEHRCRIGHDLGRFLARLHATRLPGLRLVTVDDEIEAFERKFLAARASIAEWFLASEIHQLDEFFTARVPAVMRALGGSSVTCHGDLGAYNLILGDDGRIGIIDFGDVGLIDPAKDFMGLADPAMVDAALDAYGREDAQLREKVHIRALALPILDLPFYLGKGDADGVAECISRLRGSLL